MNTYFIINLLITLLSGLSLALLTNAPARSRFYVCLFTIICWLLPWSHLQLATEITSLYLPFNVVFELKNIVPELTLSANDLANVAVAPKDNWSWLSINTLTQWFWPVSLFIGLFLFCRDIVSYHLLQQQWLKRSKLNNALWYQAGFDIQHCAIRSMDDCGPGMATGILKPVIWLNQQQHNSSTLHTILLHELTHIRQHDPLWLWLLNLLKCLMWWNPIVRWLCRYSARQIELSCDEQCQQLLPKGQYQQQLIELTLWANQQRKKLSTLATKSMPMILEMSSTKAFNLQRIQHLNKETIMKLRYRLVLLTLLTTSTGLAWSNANINKKSTEIQSTQTDSLAQVFQLISIKDFKGADKLLSGMSNNIEQYSKQQQFDIWYFSAINLYEQDDQNLQILDLLDKAFTISAFAEQQQLQRTLQTAVGFALYLEQPNKLLNYAEYWQQSGIEMPQKSRFFVALAHYQLKLYDVAINQLASLVTEAENNGQNPKENWLSILVGSYSEQGDYAKAYEVQQKTEALYPSEKNQRLLNDFKMATQSI